MDRSFLSDEAVVKASRQFVCARLATYENDIENKFLKSIVRTGSGELENTAFAIFAPDGKEKLSRASRSTRQVFANAEEMASQMQVYAKKYTPRETGTRTLPVVERVSLGLTISAADNMPLVVLAGGKDAEEQLAKLAWGEEFIGKFNYAIAKTKDDWDGIKGETVTAGIVVVQPDKFGREGKIIARSEDPTMWAKTLQAGLKDFTKEQKSQRTHLNAGREAGVFYEPKTPVTDPMENKARERMKPKKD